MWIHRLSEVDEILKRAVCEKCGPVRVTRKRAGFRCSSASYASDIKRKYGALSTGRPSSCEVCGSKERIVYDHSHVTGVFRGWLCNSCNLVLGFVRDDALILRRLCDYLEESRNKDINLGQK